MRNCVSNGVRTSRCRTVFSLSPSKRPRTSPLSKSVCNRVCALSYRAVHRRSSGVSVIYRVLPAPGFHRWERPSFHQQQDLNLQLNPQLCCHEARLYQLSYVGMCGLPFARPLSSFVRYTAHSHTDRLRPCPLVLHIGLAPLPRRSLRNAAPLFFVDRIGYAAYKIAPH